MPNYAENAQDLLNAFTPVPNSQQDASVLALAKYKFEKQTPDLAAEAISNVSGFGKEHVIVGIAIKIPQEKTKAYSLKAPVRKMSQLPSFGHIIRPTEIVTAYKSEDAPKIRTGEDFRTFLGSNRGLVPQLDEILTDEHNYMAVVGKGNSDFLGVYFTAGPSPAEGGRFTRTSLRDSAYWLRNRTLELAGRKLPVVELV